MSGSNCCFLSCMQVSQEAGNVVWYSHLIKNIPQFVVTHTVKGFSVVSEAEVDFFFFLIPLSLLWQCMLAVWFLILLPFLNPACSPGSSQFMYCWSLAWISLFLIVFLKHIKFRNFEAYSRLRRRNMFEARADFDSQVFTWTLAQLSISSLSCLECVWSHFSSSSHFSDFSCLKTAQCIQNLFLNWKLNNPKMDSPELPS